MKTRSLLWFQRFSECALVMVFFFLFLEKISLLDDNIDLGRHLMNGRLILNGQFQVLFQNTYSFLFPTFPVVNHHWLFGVLMYPIYALFSFSGLIWVKTIWILCVLQDVWRYTVRRSGFWIAFTWAPLALMVLSTRNVIRPELISLTFIWLFWRWVEAFWKGKNPSWVWLILFQIFWVNGHLYFFVGPIMVAGALLWQHFFGDKIKSRLPHMLFFGVLGVCFLNPNGVDGLLMPIHILNQLTIPGADTISPLRIPIRLNARQWAFWFWMVSWIVMGLFRFPEGKKKIAHAIVWIGGMALGFSMLRNAALFSLITFPILVEWSRVWFSKTRTVGVISGGLILCLGLSLIVSHPYMPTRREKGLGLKAEAQQIFNWIRNASVSGPAITLFDTGSMVMLASGGKLLVWADSRPEAYPQSFWKLEYGHINSELLDQAVAGLVPAWTWGLFSHYFPAERWQVLKTEHWVYLEKK